MSLSLLINLLDRVLEKEGKIDLFIHLGDIEGGESYINSVVECEKHMVRGNNDFFSDLPREEEIDIGISTFIINHLRFSLLICVLSHRALCLGDLLHFFVPG